MQVPATIHSPQIHLLIEHLVVLVLEIACWLGGVTQVSRGSRGKHLRSKPTAVLLRTASIIFFGLKHHFFASFKGVLALTQAPLEHTALVFQDALNICFHSRTGRFIQVLSLSVEGELFQVV